MRIVITIRATHAKKELRLFRPNPVNRAVARSYVHKILLGYTLCEPASSMMTN